MGGHTGNSQEMKPMAVSETEPNPNVKRINAQLDFINILSSRILELDESQVEILTDSNLTDIKRVEKIEEVTKVIKSFEQLIKEKRSSVAELRGQEAEKNTEMTPTTVISATGTPQNASGTTSHPEEEKNNNIILKEKINGGPLLTSNDSKGDYYKVVTSRNETIKFYFKDPAASFKYVLESKRDYPIWCRRFRSFCKKWNFDDITKGEPLTATEDEALKPVLENTVGKDFNSQIIDCETATDL